MTLGIQLKANPTREQKNILSQWMGCACYIWNSKTRQEKDLRIKVNSIESKEYPNIDQSYAHFKSKEDTPWLLELPKPYFVQVV